MKKILLVVATVVAVFIVLKIVFALFSALLGMLLFFGVLALFGFGAYSVMRVVTKTRRNRSLSDPPHWPAEIRAATDMRHTAA